MPKLVDIYASYWSRQYQNIFDLKYYVISLNIHQSFKTKIFKMHNDAAKNEVYGQDLTNYC